MTDTPKQPQPKIVRTFLCEKCGAETKTDAEYKQHKIDHMQGRIADKKIDPLAGPVEETTVEASVVSPTPEQKANAPWNKGKPLDPKKVESPGVYIPPKPEPITLKYIYVGTCPSCNSQVDTIPLDVDMEKQKKHVIIAWCNTCKKNIQQRNVVKL